MNNNIASILTTAYEIEGLLLVVSRHGNETPSLVYERIQQAAAKLNEQCKTLTPATEPQPAVVAAPAPQPVVEEPAPVVEEAPVEQPAPVVEEEPAVEEAPVVAEEPQQVPVEDREPDEDIDFEFVYAEDDKQDDEEMEVSQQDDDDLPQSPFSFSSEIEEKVLADDLHVVMPTPMEPETPAPAVEETVVPAAAVAVEPEQEPIRVDEQLQRHMSKDLRTAFSINDKFRFRRELFENDDYVMNNALDLIMAMESAQEAENYFLNELGWDADSPEVIDFLNIVRKHFA